MNSKKYQWRYEQKNEQNYVLAKGFNAVIIRNIGAATCLINGATLNPGDELTLEGWPGEEDVTEYKISWLTTGGTLDVWYKEYR